MTVSSEISKSGPYVCNGVTTTFPYGFRILDKSHVRVVLADADGVETDLVVEVNFTVSGVGDAGGGDVVVTPAPAAGNTITNLRKPPFTQETDLQNQGAYYAQTVEDRFDMITMQIQTVKERSDRSIALPASDATDDLDGLVEDIRLIAANIDEILEAAGDFAGAASSVADNVVTFADTSGKVGKDSGVAIFSLATKASPGLTGTPTTPTAAPGTNTTQIASTAFVKAAVDVVLGGVSTAFDTLSEIATAIGLLAPKASPALTGTPTAPTASGGTNTTQLATTAFVTAAMSAVSPNYGAGNAALAYGGVGTYVWGSTRSTGITDGNTVAGSAIQPAGLIRNTTTAMTDDSGAGPDGVKGGTALSGTWRVMGRSNSVSATVYDRQTLFLRIS